MSRQDANAAFARTSFLYGGNAAYVDDLYARYESDPQSVEADYGERQAEPWLDLSRYADSDGYEKDLNRTAWKYRDWLIGAFNRNLPYDRFTLEQIESFQKNPDIARAMPG